MILLDKITKDIVESQNNIFIFISALCTTYTKLCNDFKVIVQNNAQNLMLPELISQYYSKQNTVITEAVEIMSKKLSNVNTYLASILETLFGILFHEIILCSEYRNPDNDSSCDIGIILINNCKKQFQNNANFDIIHNFNNIVNMYYSKRKYFNNKITKMMPFTDKFFIQNNIIDQNNILLLTNNLHNKILNISLN